jgi:aspartyl aminopeptidase
MCFGPVDRGVNDNLKFNQETEFVPILGQIASQLNSSNVSDDEESDAVKVVPSTAANVQGNHHPALLSLLAEELSVVAEDIRDFELYDVSTFLPCYMLLTDTVLYTTHNLAPLVA